MAPKGTKRSATSPPRGSTRKKSSTADPVGPKTKEVVKAINMAETMSASCKEMLSDMVKSSLTIHAADRHAYQIQATRMIGETITAVQTQLQNAVESHQATVDNSDREKASRDSALEVAAANLADLEKNSTAAEVAVDDGKAAVATAKANLASAQEEIETNEEDFTSKTAQKAKLETTLKDTYEPLKTSKAAGRDGKKALDTLEKIFADVGVEAGLVESMADTFKKDPEARRTFDGLVVKHLDEQTTRCMATVEGGLTTAEQKKAGLADARTSAEAACTAADAELSASITAKDEVETRLKAGKEAHKSSETAVSGFGVEMANAAEGLGHAKTKLASFTDGPLQSFTALRDMAPPPEPEPEVEAVAPAEPVDVVMA